MNTESGEKWRTDLQKWAIPSEILHQAPENPYIHPAINFTVPLVIEDSPSNFRAREILTHGSSVLDIGCGGGIAAMACVPPANHLIGVDHQSEMLEMFAENAAQRGASSEIYEGFWPELSSQVPVADVVTAYHVLYNVQNIEDFLLAMDSHASKRVVIEMPQRHPQSTSAIYWKNFWNVDRPEGPVPDQIITILRELGVSANIELWEGKMGRGLSLEEESAFMTTRLCLPQSREPEVREFMSRQSKLVMRPLATIWWDK